MEINYCQILSTTHSNQHTQKYNKTNTSKAWRKVSRLVGFVPVNKILYSSSFSRGNSSPKCQGNKIEQDKNNLNSLFATFAMFKLPHLHLLTPPWAPQADPASPAFSVDVPVDPCPFAPPAPSRRPLLSLALMKDEKKEEMNRREMRDEEKEETRREREESNGKNRRREADQKRKKYHDLKPRSKGKNITKNYYLNIFVLIESERDSTETWWELFKIYQTWKEICSVNEDLLVIYL